MKKEIFIGATIVLSFTVFVGLEGRSFGAASGGAELFRKHCVVCHPDGGNIVSPKKTLLKKDLELNNIKTEKDIVNLMRNPGPGMTKFDSKTISDAEAKRIAKYILKTFK